MNIYKVLLLMMLFFSVSFLFPKVSHAIDLKGMLDSENSIIIKIQERIEYLFAFKVETKVQVLESQAEKRLSLAQKYAEDGNGERVRNVLQNYLQIKERQNDLLDEPDAENVLESVKGRTIEQQKTMEGIKTKIDKNGKLEVARVQENVVNQVAKRVIEFNGPEGQTEFFNKVEHVWAPGTGPGGEAGTSFAPGTSGTGPGGVTVKGGGTQFAPGTSGGGQGGVIVEGGMIQFAPGTSGGGPAGADIKTVEVKTGGGDSGETNVVESGNQNAAPGTTSGDNVNTTVNRIDPGEGGNLAPGTTLKGETQFAP